jgi:hypothetical protein
MAMLTWLADALRAGGCRVIEQAGWKQRGHGQMGLVTGVLCHHTGGGGSNDWTIVQNGRSDLPGPLAHMTLERDGSFRVIAAGQCWHAGAGGPLLAAPKNNGNEHLIGIEGVCNGRDWTDAQREAYPRGVAALLRHESLKADRCAGHKEWAPGRKPDPGNWDMGAFRNAVSSHLTRNAEIRPASAIPRIGLPLMIERAFGPGDSGMRIVCPTGSASALVAESWLSVSVDGSAAVTVWPQRGGQQGPEGTAVASQWSLRPGNRVWCALPSGTEFVTVHVSGSTGPGSVLIEQRPK